MINILDRITSYRTKKGWTEYQLAEESGLTQSTISSWYRKNLVPSIPSLEKICPRPVLLHRRDFLFPDPGTAHPARRSRTAERGAAACADCFF